MCELYKSKFCESRLVEDASVALSVQVENQQHIIIVGQQDFPGQDV